MLDESELRAQFSAKFLDNPSMSCGYVEKLVELDRVRLCKSAQSPHRRMVVMTGERDAFRWNWGRGRIHC